MVYDSWRANFPQREDKREMKDGDGNNFFTRRIGELYKK